MREQSYLCISYSMSQSNSEDSVNTGQNLPSDNVAVALPVIAVLGTAVGIVSALTVDKENAKVEHVEVSDRNAPASHLAIGTLADNLVASESGSVHNITRHPGRETVCP